MPGTNATLGFGSQIYVRLHSGSGSGSGAFTKIAQTKDLKSPTPEVGKVKITNNDSPNNTHEYVGGMIEPGDLEIEMVYTSAEALTIYGMLGDGNLYDFVEQYKDNSGWTFTGFWTKLGIETKTEDEANTATASIQLTAKPVYAATVVVS